MAKKSKAKKSSKKQSKSKKSKVDVPEFGGFAMPTSTAKPKSKSKKTAEGGFGQSVRY